MALSAGRSGSCSVRPTVARVESSLQAQALLMRSRSFCTSVGSLISHARPDRRGDTR